MSRPIGSRSKRGRTASAAENGPLVAEAEALFREGRTRAVVEFADTHPNRDLPSRVLTVAGMALYELGLVTSSIGKLRAGFAKSGDGSASEQFEAALELFSRESQFLAPDEALPLLSDLRQLATRAAGPRSLGQLHLVVARLEGTRGNCINARRHARTAAELLARAQGIPTRTELVNAGLEMVAGNLASAVNSARAGVEAARQSSMAIPLAGSLANLGALMVATGKIDRARECLDQALRLSDDLVHQVRFSALDNYAQLSLLVGNTASARDYIQKCDDSLVVQVLPARSWYDLAHQMTKHIEYLHYRICSCMDVNIMLSRIWEQAKMRSRWT